MNVRKEMVDSPKHYNSHPSKKECIEIVRYYCFDVGNAMKYLWRAGLKGEEGMTGRDKEVEDCMKAIWYLKDYVHSTGSMQRVTLQGDVKHPSGLECDDIADYFNDYIAEAFRQLWWVGVVIDGSLFRPKRELYKVWMAIENIKKHIHDIEMHESA